MAKSKRRRNSIATLEALGQWLKDNKEQLLTDRKSEADTVADASAALAKPVSLTMLRAAKSLTGVEWEAQRGEGRVNTQELARACSSAVADICKKLDMPVPKKIQDHLREEASRKKATARNGAKPAAEQPVER